MLPALSLAAAFALSSPAVAGPQIQVTAGDLSNGSRITIQGQGFGTKEHPLPIYYASFGDGNVKTHPTLSRYQYTPGSAAGEIVRSDGTVIFDHEGSGRSGGSVNSGAPLLVAPGSTHVQRRWIGGPNFTSVGLGRISIPAEAIDTEDHKLFTFWRVRLDGHGHDTPYGSSNTKLQRMDASFPLRDYYPSYNPVRGQVNIEYHAWDGVRRNDRTGRDRWRAHLPVAGEWRSLWLEHHEADPREYNGIIRYYRDGSLLNRDPLSETVPMRDTHEAGDPSLVFQRMFFWQNVRRSESDGQPWYVFTDTLYVDNTLARVMISDRPTFEPRADDGNFGEWEVQVARSWKSNEIEFDLRRGPLVGADELYLYVFDHEGNVNTNGHLMTAACTDCPNAPTEIRVY